MKRVIVKAKVEDKISLIKNIQATGHDFGKVIFQNDRIFLPRGYQPSRNLPKLMVRTEIIDPKRKPWFQLIQKRHLREENVDLVNETPVLNYTETAHIVQQLGFEFKAEVTRNRQKLQVEDTIFYLDDVEGLGTYIKVEKELSKNENIEEVRNELWNILEVLGIDRSAGEGDTYTAQILKMKSAK
ncbi:MAG: CYTH domain-containing protein [bacterium]|nr:CYTH domain-containing protein [bacterium]